LVLLVLGHISKWRQITILPPGNVVMAFLFGKVEESKLI
jgi:hypothetical protein